MSFRRTQSRAINHHVFLDNRLTNFVGEHVHFGDLIVERNALINGNFSVKNDFLIDGNLTVKKDGFIEGNLTVKKDGFIDGNLTVKKDGFIDGNLTIKKETLVEGNLTVKKDTLVDGNLTVKKDTLVEGNLTVKKDTLVEGNLTVKKDGIIDGNLTVKKDGLINGNLTVDKDIRARSFYGTGNYYLDNYILIPAGTIVQSAAINVPDGWFYCDGSARNKTEYVDLFVAIGVAYGGTEFTFNLPDMQGRVGVGVGAGTGLTPRSMGQKSGVETHALNVGEMPAHTHTGTTDANGAHVHTQTSTNDDFNNSSSSTGYSDPLNKPSFPQYDSGTDKTWTNINSAGTHSHGFTTDSTGSGAPHNNMQPFLVIRYLIKY